MTEQEKAELLATMIDYLAIEEDAPISPVLVDPDGLQGIWVIVFGCWAYMGANLSTATQTAKLSDWWIPDRDGPMMEEDLEWFEQRASDDIYWEIEEPNMFREERNRRRCQNLSLTVKGELF
jgi:hypothetical protein